MAEKRTRKTIAVLLALALFLAAPALFPPAAFAADDTLEKLLPGQWSETYENQEEEDAAEKSITSTMVFEGETVNNSSSIVGPRKLPTAFLVKMGGAGNE